MPVGLPSGSRTTPKITVTSVPSTSAPLEFYNRAHHRRNVRGSARVRSVGAASVIAAMPESKMGCDSLLVESDVADEQGKRQGPTEADHSGPGGDDELACG